MTKSPRLAIVLLAAASLMQVACAGLPEEGDAEPGVAEAEQAATIENGMDLNGMDLNGMDLNGLDLYAMQTGTLDPSSLILEQLEEPMARELLSFVVSCALEDGAHFDLEIEGQTYGFDGSLGVAPEWGEPGGECDETCQSWVSACVLSRVNYLGESVMISMRGKHPGLATTWQERHQYTYREAAYFGDIFTEPKELYACLPPHRTQIPRVCGPDIDGCRVEVVGRCKDVCKEERWDGSYAKCKDSTGTRHRGAVTVFLDP